MKKNSKKAMLAIRIIVITIMLIVFISLFFSNFVLFVLCLMIIPPIYINIKELKEKEKYENIEVKDKIDEMLEDPEKEEEKEENKNKNKPATTVIGLDMEVSDLDINHDGVISFSEKYNLTEEEVLKQIREDNNNFKKEEFYKYTKIVFQKIIEMFKTNNYQIMRKYTSNSMYYQLKMKIEEYNNNNYKRNIENLKIKGALIKEYKKDGDREFIVVSVACRMIDYLQDKNLNIIAGKENKIEEKIYLLTFTKNVNTKIEEENIKCSNCGNKIDYINQEVCQYCNTPIILNDIYWVLIDIRNMKFK